VSAAPATPKRTRRRTAAAADLDALLAAKEMVLVVGSGGVGKTTVAASLAATAAAELGGRVLVVTVDPARRLATAMGVGALGNRAVQVPPESFGPTPPRGELWAAMLDTKAGWDELIRRHAPDAATRDAVLANNLYRNLSSRFVHSHDYLAMEQLHEYHASGEYDLIIVDTPPSRNALSVLDAPRRMREFFGSWLLRWLTVPYRSRLFTAASKPFYQVADRVLGSRFVQDIADFFILFQTMEPAFVAHADEVETLLGDLRTTFVVVTTLEAAPTHEAMYLVRELARREFHLGAVVANRALPPSLSARTAARSAQRLAGAVDTLADPVAAQLGVDPAVASSVLAEIAERFPQLALVATREAERRAELGAVAPLVVSAPPFGHDVNDVADLLALGAHLRG
jgi:anion-transporting  ArsA/GET3 family ATPase